MTDDQGNDRIRASDPPPFFNFICLLIVVLCLGFEALGFLGIFNRIALLSLFAGAFALALKRNSGLLAGAQSAFQSQPLPEKVLLALFGLFVAYKIVFALSAPPYDGDTLLYHAPLASEIARRADVYAGQMSSSPFWSYPALSELWGAAAFVLFNSELLYNVSLLPFYVLLLLAAHRIALSLDPSAHRGAVWAAILLATSPIIQRQFISGGANDFCVAALILAAVSLFIRLPASAGIPRGRSAALIGLMLGCAAAVKFQAVPMVAAVYLWMGVEAFRLRKLNRREWLYLTVSIGLLVVPWLLRNAHALSGASPLHPAEFFNWRSLTGLEGEENSFASSVLYNLVTKFGSAFPLLIFALVKLGGVGACAGLMLMWVRRPPRSYLILFAFLAFTYALTPLTAENVPDTLNQLRLGWTVRFMLPILGLGLAFAAPALQRLARAGSAGQGILFVLIVLQLAGNPSALLSGHKLVLSFDSIGFVQACVWIVGILLSAAVLLWIPALALLLARGRKLRLWSATGLATGIVVVCLLGLSRQVHQRDEIYSKLWVREGHPHIVLDRYRELAVGAGQVGTNYRYPHALSRAWDDPVVRYGLRSVDVNRPKLLIVNQAQDDSFLSLDVLTREGYSIVMFEDDWILALDVRLVSTGD